MEKYNIGDVRWLKELKTKFQQFINNYPRRFANIVHSINSVGDYLRNTKNCRMCFDLEGEAEDSKYIVYGVTGIKDCYDSYGVGIGVEREYEVTASGSSMQDGAFLVMVPSSNFVRYCYLCRGLSNCFGCVGLRNKEYCILNKQYPKEEYEKLVPKIIQHMNAMPYIDKKGRIYKYGEFFPPELSPFAYNETIAQEYFPLTKEQVLTQGYRWKDPKERNIKPDFYTQDLPDHIQDVKDNILGKVIQCAHSRVKEDGTLEINCNEQCTTAFKIIPEELQFYRKMNLPLPRLCPNCRHYQRLKQRNPLKLWHRKCNCEGTQGKNSNNPNIYQNQTIHFHKNNPCPNEFETSYSPERPEIVYCEECYNAEVV
jgi:hypothetical protein